MMVYIATRSKMPLREEFGLVIATNQAFEMVTLLSFLCEGAPLVTPTAREFSRTNFNEAVKHFLDRIQEE